MRRVFWLTVLSLSLAFAATACKGKDKGDKSGAAKDTAPKTTPTPTPTPKTDGPKLASGDDLAARYQACLGFTDAKDFDNLATCYADKATSTYVDFEPPSAEQGRDAIIKGVKENFENFPSAGYDLQLLLVRNAGEAVAVGLTHGTVTADEEEAGEGEGEAEPTKIGILGATHSMFDAQGATTSEAHFLDQMTLMGQIAGSEMPYRKAMEPDPGPAIVVVAAGDDKEAANLAVVAKAYEAMNSHDAAKVMELYTDDVEFKYMASHQDTNGKETVSKELQEYFKMTTDVSFTTEWSWAAGDYVVAQVKSKGTNDGPIPGGMKATGKKYETSELDIYQLRDGKIAKQWIFSNGYAFASQLGLIPPPEE